MAAYAFAVGWCKDRGGQQNYGHQPQGRKMSDVFERLKCGSAAHKVKVNSDGSFTLEPLADKDSLKAFQPKAKEALQAASEGQFTIIQTHTSDGVSGNLYDQIIISRA
jgi:hypothetical protein